MLADLRFALRQFAKSPGFVAVAILTLALGIGANTAIFSIVDALLLKPLPYPDSDRIVQIWEAPETGGRSQASGGVFMDWQDHTTQLETVAAIHMIDANLTGEGEPVRISGAEVSADYLRVLRVNPKLGRGFSPQDDAPGGNRHVVILSCELWQSRFNGNPNIVGRAIRLDGLSYTVIGVLAPNALVNSRGDFLVPATIRADAWKQPRNYNYICFVIGRLKSGATIQQAQEELATVKRALNASYPQFKQPWSVTIQTLQESLFGDLRPYVLTLLAAVGLVLLIACANIANLLLAKGASRQGEIAVRVALGASTGRIVRQLLTESLLLAVIGGAAGVVLGVYAVPALLAFTGVKAGGGMEIGCDARVFSFALATILTTGLLFGIFPALSVARPDLNQHLKEGARGSTTGSRRRMQSLLIVSETTLTVVLLTSAGLLLRSFIKVLNANPGFNRENVLTFELTQPGRKAPTSGHRVRFVRDILQKIEQIPGVAGAGMASSAPMSKPVGYFDDVASRADRPETRENFHSGFDAIAGGFFQVVEIPLLRGRLFTEADNEEKAPKVIIINQTVARRLFGDDDPLGHQLHTLDATWEIVGIVDDIRQYQLDVQPRPHFYVPQVHFPWFTSILVRTRLPPLTLAGEVRKAVRAVDPEQPIANLGTLEQSVEKTLQTRRTMLTLIGVFSVTALVLACIGIYGIMAYAVAQRTRELGIRIALGAGAGQVVTLVMRSGLKLVLIGLGIGAVCSIGAGYLIASQLYDVSRVDPAVFAVVALALLAATTAACWLPARKATRVNPIDALRAE
jgi:predicted permease